MGRRAVRRLLDAQEQELAYLSLLCGAGPDAALEHLILGS